MKTIFFAIVAFVIASPSYALFSPLETKELPTSRWQVQYTGETEVDGMRVAVLLENCIQDMSIPELRVRYQMIDAQKEPHTAWRLTLVSEQQISLRASVPLTKNIAFVDGTPMKVFFTKQASASGFNFVIRGLPDGNLKVQYVRTAEGGETQGEFQMIPAVQVM